MMESDIKKMAGHGALPIHLNCDYIKGDL